MRRFLNRAAPATLWMSLVAAAGAPSASSAQDDEVFVIRGARVHTLAGEPIENGTIVIRGGRISEVGSASDVTVPSGADVIDATGLEVYPGIMDSVSQLGMTEIGSTAATVDTVELGDFNPQLRAAAAVHPASEHIPVARANGITHAVAAPGLGRGTSFGIQGQASLFNLAGWTVEEMSVDPSVGMMLSWPGLSTRSFDASTFESRTRPFGEVKEEYEERVAELSDWIESARRYARMMEAGSDDLEIDLGLEALVPVVRGELPLLVYADDDRDIRNAVAFCDDHGLKMILLGGRDSWKVKERLREKGIPVVLGPTLALPATEDTAYDKPFTTAAELQQAGVRVVFASYGSSNSRLLPYEVGNAVAHGLPWEEGLKAVTIYPAELFGLADELGTIEEGKRANLIVTNGDPLEIRTEIQALVIDGKPTSLDNKHLRLYETYRARP